MTFQSPLWLLGAARRRRAGRALRACCSCAGRPYAARFTNVALLGSLVPKRPGWRRHLAFGVVALGLAALVVSLAVPSTEVRVPRERATVIMARRRVAVDEGHRHRARPLPGDAEGGQGVRRRAARRGSTSGWCPSPARRPRWCTPTTDRAAGARTRSTTCELAESTAIGEAIFTSLTRDRELPVDASRARPRRPPPARIVLLSDGYNTVGRDDTQAVDAAKAAGVPVSTIAFGTDYGTLDLDGETVPVPVDRATLKEIADETGGSYSEAATAAELEQVYADLGSQIGYTTEPQGHQPLVRPRSACCSR